jgi:hypothetical protein
VCEEIDVGEITAGIADAGCPGKAGDAGVAHQGTTRPKVLAFENHLDMTRGCATWGPSFKNRTVVEREEYVRCWNSICSQPRRYVLLRGTKGIGTSVFIYWLIHKIVEKARAESRSVPTFLLIDVDGRHDFLTVEDGTPVTRRVNPWTVAADYVLSDFESDTGAVCAHWTLKVVSYGAAAEPRRFEYMTIDAREVCLDITAVVVIAKLMVGLVV